MPTVLALEPWLGGSHERFLEQWRARSAHRVEVAGLPARHWKWRMRAAAWELAQQVRDQPPPDVLLVSDYVDLPALLGWLPAEWAARPALVYFHENQLTYPGPAGAEPAERDAGYGFTNVMSCVRAARVAFNSRYHRDDFGRAARELLRRLPRPNPARELDAALDAAAVVSPGIELEALPLGDGPPAGAPLRVAFNHRWEHDKDPVGFLAAAREAVRRGAALELVLLGERFKELPAGVEALLDELRPSIVHAGFAPDRAAYAELLGGCDAVVSTARHEFCGLSVLEAMACGCAPLLPDRLSYPELVPRDSHPEAFYADEAPAAGGGALVGGLLEAADRARERSIEGRSRWRSLVSEHDAGRTAAELDRLVESLVRAAANPC